LRAQIRRANVFFRNLILLKEGKILRHALIGLLLRRRRVLRRDMATTLGVSTLDLLPWAIQCYAAIFFALIYGFSGVGIARTASA
ncbi:hypothetical protein MJI20_31815, partial [Salmonella enterica subsp. enterica serovar Anatum]|nr:hypothetical protein [Salmonella enterica subsp. enterica serovar Anatum]